MLHSHHFSNKHLLFYRNVNSQLHNYFSVYEIGFNSVPAGLKQILTRDQYLIHYVTKGKGSFMGEPFSAGDCYFVAPGELEIVEAAKGEPYECAWIIFEGRKARDLLAQCGFPSHNSIFRFEKAIECAEIIKEYLFAYTYENEFIEGSKMEEVFYKLMAKHFEYSTATINYTNNKALEIAEYIEKHFSSNIKIGELCNVFYLSKNYLCTVFKKEYGVTPQEYLISYRMEKARRLLSLDSNQLSISEISFSVGIDNPLYFSRCFQKRYGVSPSEYRKNKKNKRSDSQKRTQA